MGGKLGTILARAGHEVVFSYSHSREKLEQLASDAGARAKARGSRSHHLRRRGVGGQAAARPCGFRLQHRAE